jgi:hypothetical protein
MEKTLKQIDRCIEMIAELGIQMAHLRHSITETPQPIRQTDFDDSLLTMADLVNMGVFTSSSNGYVLIGQGKGPNVTRINGNVYFKFEYVDKYTTEQQLYGALRTRKRVETTGKILDGIYELVGGERFFSNEILGHVTKENLTESEAQLRQLILSITPDLKPIAFGRYLGDIVDKEINGFKLVAASKYQATLWRIEKLKDVHEENNESRKETSKEY